MALSKSVEIDSGAAATYWRIVRVDIDLIERKAWFALSGYLSAEARQAGKAAATQKSFTMDLPPDTEPEAIGRADLYAFAKTQEMFADATDV